MSTATDPWMRKAAKIAPPDPGVDVVDVDMTHVYTALGVLGMSTLGLGVVSTVLWRRTKHTKEMMEAMSQFVSTLVNETDCGQKAYVAIATKAEEEGVTDTGMPSWDEEDLIDKPTGSTRADLAAAIRNIESNKESQ